MIEEKKDASDHKALIIAVSLLLACLTPVFMLFYGELSLPTPGQGQMTAKSILDALERYKTDHGNYPTSLNELIPVYMDGIPSAGSSEPFSYELHMLKDGSQSEYELWFRSKFSRPVCFDSISMSWTVSGDSVCPGIR